MRREFNAIHGTLERSVLKVEGRGVLAGLGEMCPLFQPAWPIYTLQAPRSSMNQQLSVVAENLHSRSWSSIPSFLTEKGNGMPTESHGRDGRDWKQLCAAASQEPDSEKLVSLVHQILQAFNEQDDEKKNPAAADIHSALL
jgi:hypothetical protein